MNQNVLTGIIIDRKALLNLDEIIHASHLTHEIIIEMIDYHVLEPSGHSPETWLFDDLCLKRAKMAASFYHDLEINMAGIALAIDLLEQIDDLESRLHILEQFIIRR